MVKIFTMVKDEIDIVKQWIIYHGCLFGWNNIFVIDNFSTDGTYELLYKFKHLINLSRENDYSQKGDYMRRLIDKHCGPNEIAFPMDIDEFIVYYDNGKINVDKKFINDYFNNLPISKIYKANYIYGLLTSPDGVQNAVKEIDYGYYHDMKNNGKSFFKRKYYKGNVDHGNHINCTDYHLSKICLVLYHYRHVEQMKKKILNYILGFEYKNNLVFLENLIKNDPHCNGNHHIKNQINVLNNTFQLKYRPNNDTDIILTPLKNKAISEYF